MNKNIIIGIVAVIILGIVGTLGYLILNNIQKENTSNNNSIKTGNVEKNNDNTTNISNGKTLVVYYSATGRTKTVAEEIANNLNADIFEIEPVDIYTSDDLDWTDSNSRVSKEHDNESLRDVKLKNTKVFNWDNYDTILIGYPIWWGIAAWPVDNFVKENDFTGKTVIPFCTSASSGLGQSSDNLEKEANGGEWKNGQRFSSEASDKDIKKWTDSLK